MQNSRLSINCVQQNMQSCIETQKIFFLNQKSKEPCNSHVVEYFRLVDEVAELEASVRQLEQKISDSEDNLRDMQVSIPMKVNVKMKIVILDPHLNTIWPFKKQ